MLKFKTLTQAIAQRLERRKAAQGGNAGVSIIEIMVVVSVIGVLMSIAIPRTRSSLKAYHLSAAVQAVTGAIQSARYQSLMHGYHYKVAFTNTTTTYQLSSKIPPAASFSNLGQVNQWSTSGDVTMTPSTTLEFYPGGTVAATVGSMTFTLTNGTTTETITVSGVGNINVTP